MIYDKQFSTRHIEGTLQALKQLETTSWVLPFPEVICLRRHEEATNSWRRRLAGEFQPQHSIQKKKKKEKGATRIPKSHGEKVPRSPKLSHETETGCDTLKEPTEVGRWGRHSQCAELSGLSITGLRPLGPHSSWQGRPA